MMLFRGGKPVGDHVITFLVTPNWEHMLVLEIELQVEPTTCDDFLVKPITYAKKCMCSVRKDFAIRVDLCVGVKALH